jgi:hypothetical protein
MNLKADMIPLSELQDQAKDYARDLAFHLRG